MTISEGDKLPDAELMRIGEDGPETVSLRELTKGQTVALFAVPGAYTGVCTTAHVPSFIRTKDEFAEKGVETVICVSVNDPFVMRAWSESTGAAAADLHMLADPDGGFTRAIGMQFDAPPAGLVGRSRRYAMLVDDGVVRTLHVEDSPGTCEASAGEALLAKI
ncbi:peroxiredoxin [Jannaschia sp. S6380]|uniref:peroxiredoxin n=1 Tax=Jannaschia sp. S6380 TaxID=2926408 RepID=UPI001FF13C8F|nr:peroxiredoxin [Jannaschia sp. S6380]MCK0168819.1 peroxiredoxin [Jannaschia sp. S6380]